MAFRKVTKHGRVMETNKRLEDFRKHKDEYFASGENSPLDPADQEGFKGLPYFPSTRHFSSSSNPTPAASKDRRSHWLPVTGKKRLSDCGNDPISGRQRRIRADPAQGFRPGPLLPAVPRRHQWAGDVHGWPLSGSAAKAERKAHDRLQLRLQPVLCIRRGMVVPVTARPEQASC